MSFKEMCVEKGAMYCNHKLGQGCETEELLYGTSTIERTNDSEENIAKGAIKYDADKPAIFRGVIDYFPRAVASIGKVSTRGAQKYAWKGWEGVPDGINRYSDALMRHLVAEGRGEEVDEETQLLHAEQVAWNAMARLELILREKEDTSALHQT